MERQYEDEIEIDLRELFFVLWREIKIILLSAVLMAMTVFIFNKFISVPQYASTSKLYILSKSTSLTSVADLQIGTNLTQDYLVIIKGRSVVEGVIKNLELDETYQSLESKLSVENPANTRILNITIVHEDPVLAKEIANEFAIVSAAYISEKMDQDPPNIIEGAIVAEKPIGPKTGRNTLLGFMFGLFLMSGVIVVLHITDDTINTEEDVEKYLGMNTLAVLPVSDAISKENKSKKKLSSNTKKNKFRFELNKKKVKKVGKATAEVNKK